MTEIYKKKILLEGYLKSKIILTSLLAWSILIAKQVHIFAYPRLKQSIFAYDCDLPFGKAADAERKNQKINHMYICGLIF